MASTVDLASILNALGQRIAPTIRRQINRRCVILRLIPIVTSGGKNVAWDVEGDGAYTEDYADGADVSSYGSDDTLQATLPWARSRSNFKMTDEAIAAAQSNGDASFLGYARRQLENAAPALAKRLNAHVFTGSGSGSNQMVGLATALSDSGTYAGISRSSYTWWRSNVIDNGGNALSIDALRRANGVTIYNASGEQADFAFCSSDTFAYIGNLFSQQRRYTSDVTVSTARRGDVKLDASIGAIEIDGCVYIKDADAPDSSVLFVNSGAVELHLLPLQAASNLLPESTEDVMPDDGFGQLPMMMKVIELARTGDARKFSLRIKPALAVTRPNACGKLTNFTKP